MKITSEKLEQNVLKLQASIEKADYIENYQELLRKERQRAVLKGFRPGKVPKSIVEKKIGPELKSQAIGKLIDEEVKKYFNEQKVVPFTDLIVSEDSPKESTLLDEDFHFIFEVGLLPAFTLDENLELPKTDVQCNDKAWQQTKDLLLAQDRINYLKEITEDSEVIIGIFIKSDFEENELNAKNLALCNIYLSDLTPGMRKKVIGQKKASNIEVPALSDFLSEDSPKYQETIGKIENFHDIKEPLVIKFFEIRGHEPQRIDEKFFREFFPTLPEEEQLPQDNLELENEFRKRYQDFVISNVEMKDARDNYETLAKNWNVEFSEAFLDKLIPKREDESDRDYDSLRAHLRHELLHLAIREAFSDFNPSEFKDQKFTRHCMNLIAIELMGIPEMEKTPTLMERGFQFLQYYPEGERKHIMQTIQEQYLQILSTLFIMDKVKLTKQKRALADLDPFGNLTEKAEKKKSKAADKTKTK